MRARREIAPERPEQAVLAPVTVLDDHRPPRLCIDCQHAALAVSGVFCMALCERIENETVAEDCELFRNI